MKLRNTIENNKAISNDYNKLLKQLENQKIASITTNKDILMTEIQDEILEQYFYKKGVYQYHLQNDETIKKAVEILNDTEKYQKILANGK